MPDPTLIQFLTNFYSRNGLQLYYATLTDKGAIPGMDNKERQMKVEAIAHILKHQPQTMKQESITDAVAESPKFPLDKAMRLAKVIVETLEDYCDEIHIAGSIRREKPEVKDIEVVCLAKRWQTGGGGLFDTPGEMVVIPAFKRAVEGLGTVIKGKPDGRYMQLLLPSGMKLDLFMPTAHDFYRQFAVRTGSADYSAKVIAGGWKAKGWCGTEHGLRRIVDCEETKSGWKVVASNPVLPPVWESEQAFFDFIGVKWVEPKLRNL